MSTVTRSSGSPRTGSSGQVDPRGQRFSAAVTAVVLVVALVASPSTLSTVLVAAQLVVFATGTFLGPARTPYALAFRTLVRPRLGPPAELEDAAPPRFAQSVGLAFAAVSLVGFLSGATAVGAVAAGFALAAAFLNAAFGYCLGCELYLIGKRAIAR
jgi:Domain of unknown function (DUF4395)